MLVKYKSNKIIRYLTDFLEWVELHKSHLKEVEYFANNDEGVYDIRTTGMGEYFDEFELIELDI